MYEYGTLKPVKVTLTRGRRKRKNNGVLNQTRVPCMPIWNVTMKPPVRVFYTNKNIRKKIILKKIKKQKSFRFNLG
jgi:hypothetical protein